MKYFVVSDVHNYYAVLKSTLSGAGFDMEDDNHKLIICGDALVFGDMAYEMYCFLKELVAKKKLIYIFGNHDLELIEDIRRAKFKKYSVKTIKDILSGFKIDCEGLDDLELAKKCREIGIDKFLEENSIPYFETKHYIFIHGFIPTINKRYLKDWRNCDLATFKESTKEDGMMLNLKYHVKEEGKTIVVGHYSAARGYLMKNADEKDWANKIYNDVSKVELEGFKACYLDGLILIDASTKKTGMINCLVVEE